MNLVGPEGELRACWRHWWMRPWSYDYGPTTPLLRGAALLLAPRGLEEVVGLLGDLRLAIHVDHKELEDLTREPPPAEEQADR
jgi:hypothetical protein